MRAQACVRAACASDCLCVYVHERLRVCDCANTCVRMLCACVHVSINI